MEPMPCSVWHTLGIVWSSIVGVDYYDGIRGAFGRRVRLVRNPENPHDPNAIAVLNPEGIQAGYLPRTDAAIFAPLMDEGRVRLVGFAGVGEEEGKVELLVFVRSREPEETWFRRRSPDELDAALHNMLLDLWTAAPSYVETYSLSEAIAALRPGMRQRRMERDTELLWRLLRDRPTDIGIRRQSPWRRTIHLFLSRIRFGTPVGWSQAVVVPLFRSDRPLSEEEAAPPPIELPPAAGGTEEILQCLSRGIAWPEDAIGYYVPGVSSIVFHVFEDPVYARANWLPVLLRQLQPATSSHAQEHDVLDLRAERRRLFDWLAGRTACYEPWRVQPHAPHLRVVAFRAGYLEGHVRMNNGVVDRFWASIGNTGAVLPPLLPEPPGAAE